MCEDLTPPGTASGYLLIAPCDGHVLEHIDELVSPDVPGQWSTSASAAAQSVIELLVQTARIVVEREYFDLDFRSEFSLTHETSFAVRSPDTLRLHLFMDEPEAGARLLEAVDQMAASYAGYVILKPQTPGTIGRSMFGLNLLCGATLGLLDETPTLDPSRVRARIRVTAVEFVTLAGVRLRVEGVPFMEQDGHILRCSHVSAWICHYVAVLRGFVARRSTGSLHRLDMSQLSGRRSYPSDGLTDLQTSVLLTHLDTPPLITYFNADSHPGTIKPNWFHNPWLWASEDGKTEGICDPQGFLVAPEINRWKRSRLTAEICRYLNSGLPVILAWCPPDIEEDHTEVLVGYVRERDFRSDLETASPPTETEETKLPTRSDDEVRAFLSVDDQYGPLRARETAELVQRLEEDEISLIVPLPRGLWLSGNKAEVSGAVAIAGLARNFGEMWETWRTTLGHAITASDEVQVEQLAFLQTVGDLFRLVEDPEFRDMPSELPFAARSYAVTATHLKRSLSERLGSTAAREVIGCTPMPKYVWAVEIISRAKREVGDDAVSATIVLDGSTPDLSEPVGLLCHLPGAILDMRNDWEDPMSWVPVPTGLYRSGRWNHAPDDGEGQEWTTLGNFKGAVAAG